MHDPFLSGNKKGAPVLRAPKFKEVYTVKRLSNVYMKYNVWLWIRQYL